MKRYLLELLKRKDLIFYLVSSNLKAEHRNSFLGYFWWLLDPLLNVFIYYFVVVVVFKSGGEGFGPFLVVGMIVWRWVSSTISSATKAIVNQAGIISQVYLPKAIFAFGATLTQTINFAFGLLVIVIFLVFFKIMPGVQLAWLPVIIAINFLFLLAIALVLAYISVFFRDMENIVNHLTRLWFFGSPVIWSRTFPPSVNWLVNGANPLAHFLSSYRNIFLYNSSPDLTPLLIIGKISIIVIIALVYIYKENEHKIIKVL